MKGAAPQVLLRLSAAISSLRSHPVASPALFMSSKAAATAASAAAAGPASVSLLKRPQLLSLYKAILRAAATFPSSKRKGIIRDIKQDWRDNRTLADPNKLHDEHTRAVNGLRTLQQYTTLNTANSSAWNLHLGRH